ncbi:cytochrome P450 [Mycena vulgaris]|nr:cytochrome P450 [Mycena vulgaris]
MLLVVAITVAAPLLVLRFMRNLKVSSTICPECDLSPTRAAYIGYRNGAERCARGDLHGTTPRRRPVLLHFVEGRDEAAAAKRIEDPACETRLALLWGDNLFSAIGDIWKRHRRILAPAFGIKLSRISLLPSGHLTRIRFGLRIGLARASSEDDRINLEDALRHVAGTRYACFRLLIFVKLKIEAFDHVWKTLDSSLYTFLHTRRTELAASPGQDAQPEAGDIFSRLVAAMDSKGKLGLDEREVIGNTFMLMFAGHESTAATVAATLGFLAIHQDQQETTYREIFTAIPVTRDPVRGFPTASVMLIAKETTEDVPIKVQSPADEVMYSNGSLMIIEMIATRISTVLLG